MSITGNVLIIDDEPALRHTLARILQQAGMEVTTAENGEQGLAFLATTPFDLVYMDLCMPGLAGLDALDLVRSRYPGLPVVLFTAQPDLNSAVEALRRGAADYLLKPIKPETLITRTATILAAQHKEKRRREILAQIDVLQAELKSLEAEQNTILTPVRALPASERYIKRGALMLDLHTRRLAVGEQTVNLPPSSFDILFVLARHAPNVVDYQTLVTEAQGIKVDAREAQELIKWHIHHIRQAIESDAHNPNYLFNVRGVGYRLIAD
jgi:DNA-binding response OmpR family regulator